MHSQLMNSRSRSSFIAGDSVAMDAIIIAMTLVLSIAPTPMASASARLRDLRALDDTKAGVKGLVDSGVTSVPSIFHHPPESLALDTCKPPRHDYTIPLIDLAALVSRRADLVAEVKASAETVGFFQVVNHGVPEEAMSGMLAAVRGFHEEPAEAKRPYYTRDMARLVRYNCNTDLFRSPSAKWRDTLYMDIAPTEPGPEEIPAACRGIAAEYARLVRRLGGTLLELLSEGLGLHPGYLEQEAGCLEVLSVAAHYYPACPEPHLTLGAARHSDPSFVTVLLQDGVGGLQVLLEEEDSVKKWMWVDVPAVAGALVVNVGDFLQLVSNGRFKSVEHRVVSTSVRPRASVACFFRGRSTRVCSPIILDDGRPPMYTRSATVEEVLSHYRDKCGQSALDYVLR